MGKWKKEKDRFREREAEKYQHPIPSREFILEVLAKRGSPATLKQIISDLELEGEQEQEALRRRLIAMVRDGQLHQNRKGAYGSVADMELIAGFVIGHKEGYGFLVPENGSDDLFLNGRQMRSVFHNDKVLARVSGVDHRGRKEGIIVDVLERNTKELVGRFNLEADVSFVEPSNSRITQDILIPSDKRGNAKSGQMVVVEIEEHPTQHSRPYGRVVEILGEHMAPGMEIEIAIRNHDLPYQWPEEVLSEAKKFSPNVSEDLLSNRDDLRHLPFVTIDGEDAKDFDDAVYCEKGKGGWTLYVAIADVSYYVRPDTALDNEALNRGNSVYFPGNVIPMLPEVLSNELCSLNPYVNRLTMTCKMNISPKGKITRYEFSETVIKSHARLTYNQVYKMVQEGHKELRQQFSELVPHLEELFTLFKILHKARKIRGAIDFDLPETKIIFGEGRKIEKIVPLVRNDAHRVIEECMLCANISAARFLEKNESPGLFRVHEGPSAEKLMDLRKFLNELGLRMPGKREPSPKDYSELLQSIQERPDVQLIQTVLLRSLSQAIYSPENKGHFGLSYETYTHFTSPIRRYPDLLVHRAIKKILRKKHIPGEQDPKLENHGEHCSMTERRADEATREAVDWLKCEYMLDKVGEEFPGMVSSVTGFGIFVMLTEVFVEGLVHISQLPNDYYHFDPIRHEMFGEKSKRKFRLGDRVKVRVARVDLDERQIDFVLAETLLEGAMEKSSRKKSNQKPKVRTETKKFKKRDKQKASPPKKKKQKKRR